MGDFAKGASYLGLVLEDARQIRNAKLWFDCARHLAQYNRTSFIRRLLELHNSDSHDLDTVFLVSALYFAEAVQTRSGESWRNHEIFRQLSDKTSTFLPVRTNIREWLYEVGGELRIYPAHLFRVKEEQPEKRVKDRGRMRLQGVVSNVNSSTSGAITIANTPFDIFFRPRISGHEFYASDAGTTRVDFLVCFTYDKPQAFDVNRLDE